MSIKTFSSSNIAPRNIPTPVFPVALTNNTPTAWTRPSDWLTLPTVLNTDQKFAGLLAITNDTTNYIAFTASTSAGTYTVDWGDGSATQTFASGATASKVFDYSSIDAGTTTTEGYRQTIITITPTTNNLTSVGLQVKYVNVPALNTYSARWLDIIVGSPYLTSTTCGAGSTTVFMSWLQQYQLMSTASTFSGLLFANCTKLQSIPTLNFSNITLNTYSGSGFFQNCTSLQVAPSIDCTKFNNMSSFFLSCTNLQIVPDYSTSINNTTCASMFSNCPSLRTIVGLDVSKVTTATSMFSTASSLLTIPRLNFSTLLTDTSSMFTGCLSLVNIPLFNTVNVTTIASMFQNCWSLQTLPLFNFGNVTTTTSWIGTCYNLRTVPGINFSKAPNISFAGATALVSVGPLITTSLLTSCTFMFQNCYNLKNISLFNTSGVTIFTNMFLNCYSLVTVPTFNTINATTMNTMFQNCRSLQTVPLFDTANVTTMTSMFSACNNLQSVPLFVTNKATDLSSMFASCVSLVTFPAFNTSNCTTMNNMFGGASSMQSIPNTFAISNVSCDTSTIFYQCLPLRTIPTTFANSLANSTNMGTMFTNCTNLEQVPDLGAKASGFSMSQTFSGCSGIASIGNINANGVGDLTTAFANCNTLSRLNVSNVRQSITLTGTLLAKTPMENVFANLISNTSGKTITISNTPASSAAVSLTGTWNNASNIITMTNTTGLIVGMTSTSANLTGNISITTYANSKISANNLAAANNMIKVFAATGGLTANTPYYVSNASGTSPTYYDVSATPGGTPLTLTAAGPANGLFDVKIASINTNANIVVTAWPSGNATTTSISSRNLNTTLATFKNFTLTG